MANLSHFEEEFRANYHNLPAFSQIVAFPTLAPQVVPEGGDGVEPAAPPAATNEQAANAAAGGKPLQEQGPNLIANEGEGQCIVREHQASVTMFYREPVQGVVVSKTGQPKLKKADSTKPIMIAMSLKLTRADFVKAFLPAHALDTVYAPSSDRGPPFKFWFAGTSGGKTGAATIDTNDEFDVLVSLLFKKSGAPCVLSISFDLENWDAFRIRKRALELEQPVNNGDHELMYGTKVPRVDHYDEDTVAKGKAILQIKQRWPCNAHLGEHGEPGHCFINKKGDHLGLNNLRLRSWASEMVAGNATRHEPPTAAEFDGVRNGGHVTARPRGRNGPLATPQQASGSNEQTTLLLATMLPLFTTLAQNANNMFRTPDRQAR